MPRQVYRVCVALPVSIRARHCWRAMHAAICCAVGIRHVSIRARHCWRAMPGHAITSSSLAIVSIRARHCWRAMRRANRLSWVASLFQSAPAIAGGRCPVTRLPPARWPCFNPRPPLLAGDAVIGGDDNVVRAVSIRARHCWRAMREMLFSVIIQPMFQSAPAIAGGRCLPALAIETATASFQSAPAIAGGRCRSHGLSVTPGSGFNPRPPLLAGDASWRRPSRARAGCFNPRPPLLAGDARRVRPRRRRPQFQSAPAIAGGRCALDPQARASLRCFNPRPPLLAGDARPSPSGAA